MRKIIDSAKNTFNFARAFARRLKGGNVIGLVGELGAGKTVFAKGLAAGLGVKEEITSPTFVLMKIYKTSGKNDIKLLCHIDAYRLKSAADITAIGAEEYFYRPDTVTVIEWADRLRGILPEKTRYIKFEHEGEDKRSIAF